MLAVDISDFILVFLYQLLSTAECLLQSFYVCGCKENSFRHRKLHKHKCIKFILSTSVGLDEALFSIIKWSHSPRASSLSPFFNLIKIIP